MLLKGSLKQLNLMDKTHLITFLNYCNENLTLANVVLSDEYYYSNIPLCIVDAVFSIGVRYESTINVVNNFCQYYSIPKIDLNRFTNITNQFSVNDFLVSCNKIGLESMVSKVYQNKQRTSPVNGILKAEAVYKFGLVLNKYQVNKFPDINKVIGNSQFEDSIKQIPGQHSGISLNYFFMLSGEDSYIKPDRMIARFVQAATGKSLNFRECQELFIEANSIFIEHYPQITPRALDHLIWEFQRNQGK